jgi:hypothetical protein
MAGEALNFDAPKSHVVTPDRTHSPPVESYAIAVCYVPMSTAAKWRRSREFAVAACAAPIGISWDWRGLVCGGLVMRGYADRC